MKIYFVVDLMGGTVVRAYWGERESYEPVHVSSKIFRQSDPEYVLNTICPKYLYVADLDRIMGRGNNFDSISFMADKVDNLMADCGFRDLSEVDGMDFKFDCVLGSETFDIRNLKDKKVDFVSLDIKDRLLDASNSFKWEDALEFLNGVSLKGVIILALSNVGTLSVDYETLIKAAEISEHPIYAGGGIKSEKDILNLKEMGYKGALIASSLHEGIIDPEIVRKGKI